MPSRNNNKYILISFLIVFIIFIIISNLLYNKFEIKDIPPELYNHIFIYNKGSTKVLNIKNSSIINLPNVGYEAHTYLYHIVYNYDKLYNCILFLPGSAWSQPYKRYQMLEIINILI